MATDGSGVAEGGLQPWQRPPFEPGHQLSMRHGAWSPRKVDPLAGELVDQLLALAAVEHSPVNYLADPTYRPSLLAWARVEARIQLLSEWLVDQGDLDDEDDVRGAANLLTRLEAQGEKLRARLGLDPLSRAKLGRDLVATQADLAALGAAGTAALEGRSTETDGADPDEDEDDA